MKIVEFKTGNKKMAFIVSSIIAFNTNDSRPGQTNIFVKGDPEPFIVTEEYRDVLATLTTTPE